VTEQGDKTTAPRLIRWSAPLYEDALLWPVLIALVGHLPVALGPLLLEALVGKSWAFVLLGVALVVSAKVVHVEWGYRERAGRLTWTVAVTWLLSVAVAWVGKTWDLL
jgi:hypothetical protein